MSINADAAGVAVRARGITKEFAGVQVLHSIDLDVVQGEVLALIGENGAGKSTLVKIIAGYHSPTSGELSIGGQRVVSFNTGAALRNGVVMIHQEQNLAEDLTVEENIFLGKELHAGPFVRQRQMAETARTLLARLESSISPGRRVRDLSVADKQMVEIAKALASKCDVIIMDEPTSVLTTSEIDVLFELIRRLKAEGITIIYISHRLREVQQICDRVAVLRDGQLVAIHTATELSEAELASLMVGRDVSMMFPPKQLSSVTVKQTVVLDVKDVRVAGPGSANSVSFQLHQGEILGFAGLVGAGRTELAEGLMGLRRRMTGSVEVYGKHINIRKPLDAISAGMVYLTEDRKGRGILVSMNLQTNVTLMNLRKYCHPFIDDRGEKDTLSRAISSYDVRTPRTDIAIEKLSGGNQQKLALAKVMDVDPSIIILDEPTRGIDVNTKQQIYALIRSLADAGKSIILISSELPEVIGMCSRVLVMRNGRMVGEVRDGLVTEENIIQYATGLKEAASV